MGLPPMACGRNCHTTQKQEAKRKEYKDFAWLRILEYFAATPPLPPAMHCRQCKAGGTQGSPKAAKTCKSTTGTVIPSLG